MAAGQLASADQAVTELLRNELGPEPALTLVTGRRGLLKRTTSGKLRRGTRLLSTRPPATVVS
ncbi:hypothetical protein ACFV98_37880 [Streptomyces violascens]|uniref:hypothetical protein n=1 Tax=Streptomyces violascens TaxID=67381 RepID=UPI00364691DB